MNLSLKSTMAQDTWRFKTVGLGLLAFSLLALLLAPRLMPASYDWLQHTTSESAAQGIPGAWLARLGFMIFGLTVIWLSVRLQDRWTLPVRWLHLAFGVFMIGAAVFSARPWLPEYPFDPVEDALHSFAATAMGFAFAGGISLRLLHREQDTRGRIIDIVAIVASVAIPLAMSGLPDWDGVLQRGMFAIAYLWYGLALFTRNDTNGNESLAN